MFGPNRVKKRFCLLASILHSDSAYGDTRRVRQRNQAIEKLRALGL